MSNATPRSVVPFNYNSNEVRTIQKEDGPIWFVAKDACDVLGLANPTKAISNLDEDEKNTLTFSEGINGQPGNPKVNIISESRLYTLIIRSNKPEAKPFQRWVTHDVLPSLRKTGTYAISPDMTDADASRALLEGARVLERAARIFRASVSIAKTAGLRRREAVIKANAMARARGGIDCLEALGIEYVNDQDQTIRFVEARCTLGEARQGGIRVLPPELYLAYTAYVADMGFEVLGKQSFYGQLTGYYPKVRRMRESHGTREYFYGIGLEGGAA